MYDKFNKLWSFVTKYGTSRKVQNGIWALEASYEYDSPPYTVIANGADGGYSHQIIIKDDKLTLFSMWSNEGTKEFSREMTDSEEIVLDEVLTMLMNDVEADAERYRWLKTRKGLSLISDTTLWTREDGTQFRSTHILCEGGTQHAPYATIDETVDMAKKLKR